MIALARIALSIVFVVGLLIFGAALILSLSREPGGETLRSVLVPLIPMAIGLLLVVLAISGFFELGDRERR